MTRDLRSLQELFAKAVLRPLDDNQRMQRGSVDGQPAERMAATFIKPSDRLSSLERLEIYNRQYWFRLINSFYDDFPALRTLMGDGPFYDLTVAYLSRHPSRSFTLRDLGAKLPEFLEAEPQRGEPHGQLALDIAKLEWAHIVAFDGAEVPPLEIDELLGSDPADLRIGPQPHLTFLACDYEVDVFVSAIRQQQFNPVETSNAVSESLEPGAAAKMPAPQAGQLWLAIHRVDNSVYYKRLQQGAYLVCTALQRGETLQTACEEAAAATNDQDAFAQTLQRWFAQWASFGWFCRRAAPAFDTTQPML